MNHTAEVGNTSGQVTSLPVAGNGTSIPTVELRRRLGAVNEYYLGLAHFMTDVAWARKPDPIRAMQFFANLIDQIDALQRHLGYLREHADLLWTISFDQAEHGPQRQ